MSIDKAAAVYVYCMNYHTGQDSKEYRIMSKLSDPNSYNIKLSNRAIDVISGEKEPRGGEWEIAAQLYYVLECKHLEKLRNSRIYDAKASLI
jgi:hypothetical protein